MARPTPHPRTLARGTREPTHGALTAIVYSSFPERTGWVEGELARTGALVQIARSVTHLVAALVHDPAPRPQILVLDVDALSGGELLELHEIRDLGWCGTIIALGRVPPSLRRSLDITRAIRPPFIEDVLAEEIGRYREACRSRTTRIPVS